MIFTDKGTDTIHLSKKADCKENLKESSKMEPLVSICMSTYKHAPFIGKAIESVLMQKTNFPFQLVIGEDSSNDGTRAVCEQYCRENHGLVKLLPSDKNYGQNIN